MMGEPVEEGALGNEGFGALYEASLREFESGTVVNGVVVDVNPSSGVVVDIGYKSEGQVPASEFSEDELASLRTGDEISVFIAGINDSEGIVYLSRRKARDMQAWKRLEEACRSGEILEGRIVGPVKGGMQVEVEGVKIFMPGSHIDLKAVRNMDEYVGLVSRFKVISTDARRKNAIVSRRAVLEEENREKREKTAAALAEGALVEGTVKNITDYGVFVDLGGIDGLLHVSDISWGRVRHPSEKFSKGQRISVVVLNYDKGSEKVTLGFKQKTPDPWLSISDRYSAGDTVSGRVMSLTDYGSFLELEEGVEGLVHISEIRWGARPRHSSEILKKGDEVQALVLKVSRDDKRISLSLKRLLPNPWDLARDKYREGHIVHGLIKNVTDFGAFVGLEDGVDGLIHVSDMSWTRHIRHPSEMFQKGQEVDAVVLSVDPARERIALGIKQLSSDPWLKGIAQRLKVNEVFQGRVIRIVDFGIFIELEEGIEGLVYASEIGKSGDDDSLKLIKPGDTVDVRVVKVDTVERKIGLSMRGLGDEEHDSG